MERIKCIPAFCLGVVLFVTYFTRSGLAQVTYVSNLADSSAADGLVEQTDWFASSFETGTDPLGYELNSIRVDLDEFTGAASGFSVSLFSDNGGKPGTSLGTLSGSADPVAGGIYTYITSGIALSPSTPYWIVSATASAEPTGFYWAITTSTTDSTSDGWSIDNMDMRVSHNQGGSWGSANPGAGQFSVTATSVPEPLALPCAAAALLMLKKKVC